MGPARLHAAKQEGLDGLILLLKPSCIWCSNMLPGKACRVCVSSSDVLAFRASAQGQQRTQAISVHLHEDQDEFLGTTEPGRGARYEPNENVLTGCCRVLDKERRLLGLTPGSTVFQIRTRKHITFFMP